MLSKDFLKPVEEEFGVRISKTNNFKQKTMYKNFRNEYEVDNLTTEYHKFSIQRTDSVITMECDDEVLISIGKS